MHNNISFVFNIYLCIDTYQPIIKLIEEDTESLGNICKYIIEGIVCSQERDVFNKKEKNMADMPFIIGRDIGKSFY